MYEYIKPFSTTTVQDTSQ